MCQHLSFATTGVSKWPWGTSIGMGHHHRVTNTARRHLKVLLLSVRPRQTIVSDLDMHLVAIRDIKSEDEEHISRHTLMPLA